MNETEIERLKGKSGVYQIRNRVNRKVYVGSTALCLQGRWRTHRNRLRAGNHDNRHLQQSWNKYGEDAFEFCLLRVCPPQECLKIEQIWIDRRQAYNKKFGYNNRPIAGSNLGKVFGPLSDNHRKKISEAGKGRCPSEETRRKIAESNTGKIHSTKTREKMRRAIRPTGWSHSESAREKISKTRRAKIADGSLTVVGHPVSDATKKKISASRAGKPLSIEHCNRISAAMRGKPWSLARREAQNLVNGN